MKKNTIYKLITATVFLALAILFMFIPDNEIIAPSAVVAFCLVLTLIGTEDATKTATGKAARFSIITFSIIVIALNILVTIFLPIISASTDLSSMSVELTTSIGTTEASAVSDHFVEVTVNDMHELCYSTAILLLINAISAFIFKRKMSSGRSTALGTDYPM